MTPWRRRNPRFADYQQLRAGSVVGASVLCIKRVATRLGRSRDMVEAYINGAPSNPVWRVTQLCEAADDPTPIATHLRIIAERRTLDGLTLPELRAELEKIIRQEEPLAEYRQNMAALAYEMPRLRETLEAEANLQIRACAIIDRITEMETR